jgi:hypothetical protein
MPSPPPGIFEGFDSQEMEATAGFYSYTGSAVTWGTTAGTRHADLETGDLEGAASWLSTSDNWLTRVHSAVLWKEVLIEYWERTVAPNCRVFIRDNDDTANHCQFYHTNTAAFHANQSGFTYADGSVAIDNNPAAGHMWSHHAKIANSGGFMVTWQDGKEVLRNTGIDTSANTGGGDAEKTVGFQFQGGNSYFDDVGIRPRTILVDGVGGAKTDTPTAITGSPSATVYGWENDSQDSAGGSGDPNLAADEWRLYLMDLSFEPGDPASGWSDNDNVTVTGLTAAVANIQVNAPHAGYAAGMEPGSMLYFNALHVIGTAPNATGTDNTAGTLQGGATDRLDALDTEGDGKEVRHTAASESVTLNSTDLTAAQIAAITEVVGIQATVRGLTDGAAPNHLAVRLLDNGASPQHRENHDTLVSSNSSRTALFPTDAGGGQWAASGTGAGTVNSAEVGYTTRTK